MYNPKENTKNKRLEWRGKRGEVGGGGGAGNGLVGVWNSVKNMCRCKTMKRNK